MANILNEHWGAKFSRRETARHRIQSWLVGVPPLPPAFDPKWSVNKEHIEQTITIAKESAPGPDGIPYNAWKKLGVLAVDVLYDVAIFMKRSDSVQFLPNDFNQAFLCCLPQGWCRALESRVGETLLLCRVGPCLCRFVIALLGRTMSHGRLFVSLHTMSYCQAFCVWRHPCRAFSARSKPCQTVSQALPPCRVEPCLMIRRVQRTPQVFSSCTICVGCLSVWSTR